MAETLPDRSKNGAEGYGYGEDDPRLAFIYKEALRGPDTPDKYVMLSEFDCRTEQSPLPG